MRCMEYVFVLFSFPHVNIVSWLQKPHIFKSMWQTEIKELIWITKKCSTNGLFYISDTSFLSPNQILVQNKEEKIMKTNEEGISHHWCRSLVQSLISKVSHTQQGYVRIYEKTNRQGREEATFQVYYFLRTLQSVLLHSHHLLRTKKCSNCHSYFQSLLFWV